MSVNTGLTNRGFEITTGLVTKQGLFDESSTPNHPTGTRMQLADGRVFYYAKAGAGAIGMGKLGQVPLPDANHVKQTIADNAVVGSKVFTFTDGGVGIAANQFAEGYLVITDGGGEGQMMKVKKNTVAASGADSVVTTYDPITVALGTTPLASLIANPYSGVVLSTTEERLPAGVALINVTAAYYFWCQTWGLANVLRGDAAAEGTRLMPGDVAGEVITDAGTYTMPMMSASALLGIDGEYHPVLLQIMP